MVDMVWLLVWTGSCGQSKTAAAQARDYGRAQLWQLHCAASSGRAAADELCVQRSHSQRAHPRNLWLQGDLPFSAAFALPYCSVTDSALQNVLPGSGNRVKQAVSSDRCRAPLQLLEWWYTSAEEKLAAEKKLAPPPPPPPPMPAPGGVALPSDPSLCPICRQVLPLFAKQAC